MIIEAVFGLCISAAVGHIISKLETLDKRLDHLEISLVELRSGRIDVWSPKS
jgi:hypothetical protein